jgi:D-arabinose 1-dehydrogenase-like Zn-dependent alcohol dehydrogenase
VDVTLDFVGGADTIQESVSVLGRGGVCCIVGYGGQTSVASRQLVQGQLVLRGSLAGSYQDLVELMELQRSGVVQSAYRRYPLEAAGDVLRLLAAGELPERAVLVP